MDRLSIVGDTAHGSHCRWPIAVVGLAAWLLATAPCLAQADANGVSGPSPIGPGQSQPAASPDALIKRVRLEQKLNAQVPLDISFRDEMGKLVPLRQYFGAKPVMLNLIQYRCT